MVYKDKHIKEQWKVKQFLLRVKGIISLVHFKGSNEVVMWGK